MTPIDLALSLDYRLHKRCVLRPSRRSILTNSTPSAGQTITSGATTGLRQSWPLTSSQWWYAKRSAVIYPTASFLFINLRLLTSKSTIALPSTTPSETASFVRRKCSAHSWLAVIWKTLWRYRITSNSTSRRRSRARRKCKWWANQLTQTFLRLRSTKWKRSTQLDVNWLMWKNSKSGNKECSKSSHTFDLPLTCLWLIIIWSII